MVDSRILILQVVLLCCSNIQASKDKNMWIFKVLAESVSDEGPSNKGETPFNIKEATLIAEEATLFTEETKLNAEKATINTEEDATSNTEDETIDADRETFDLIVNLTTSLHECETRFLSIALGTKHVNRNWSGMLLGSGKLTNIASALAPTDLRLGGTSANLMIFKPQGTDCQTGEEDESFDNDAEFDSGDFDKPVTIDNYGVSGWQWEQFNAFVSRAGWDLLFDVNNFFWTSDGLFDTTNIRQLLNYSSVKGIRIPYFQLGNEPNAYWGNYHFEILPELLYKDYVILKNLTNSFPKYAQSKLYGPDVANVFGAVTGTLDAFTYFQRFVKAGAYDVVDVYSLHHYYLNGRYATLSQFIDPKVMGGLKMSLKSSLKVANGSPRPLPIMLTETADSYGGGAAGLSDAYVGGFLWLDKLGVSAQNGVTRVFRQALFGANYALINNYGFPRPDYYTSVLFKKLIEGPVFPISIQPANDSLRVYAHCARRNIYNPGALVVYYLNLHNATINISLSQFPDYDLDLYLLTPDDEARGLRSWSLKLNGEVLKMNGDFVPPMPPKPHRGTVTVDALTYGFIVVPQANVTMCLDYYKKIDSQIMNTSE